MQYHQQHFQRDHIWWNFREQGSGKTVLIAGQVQSIGECDIKLFFKILVEGHIFCLNLECESQMLIAGKMNCQLHTLNWWREKTWLQNGKKNSRNFSIGPGTWAPIYVSGCL